MNELQKSSICEKSLFVKYNKNILRFVSLIELIKGERYKVNSTWNYKKAHKGDSNVMPLWTKS